MQRRTAISLLLGCAPSLNSKPRLTLNRFLPANDGCALLLDVASQEIIASNSSALYDKILVPPGSTLKPLSLAALLSTGRLRATESYLCPGNLTIPGRRMDCSHPPIVTPMRIDTALAYSCNCFTAHAAQRFVPGELSRSLRTANLVPGDITTAQTKEAQQLQALGEADILVTPLGLAHAYRQLALRLTSTNAATGMDRILAGLEEAVEFGTGHEAQIKGARLAGKTGSTRNGQDFIAWFAGFLPSHAPKAVVTVMLTGKHGGSDAAPIAKEILDSWLAGNL